MLDKLHDTRTAPHLQASNVRTPQRGSVGFGTALRQGQGAEAGGASLSGVTSISFFFEELRWSIGYSLTLMENTSCHPMFRIAQSHIVDIMGILWGFWSPPTGTTIWTRTSPTGDAKRGNSTSVCCTPAMCPIFCGSIFGSISVWLIVLEWMQACSFWRFPKSWRVPYLIPN